MRACYMRCPIWHISVAGVSAGREGGRQPSEVDGEEKVIVEVVGLKTVDSIDRPTRVVLSRRGEVRMARRWCRQSSARMVVLTGL